MYRQFRGVEGLFVGNSGWGEVQDEPAIVLLDDSRVLKGGGSGGVCT